MAEDKGTSAPDGEDRDAIADDAKAQAKAHGATGPGNYGRLSASQRALRDGAVIAALHAGEKPKDVAAEFEITTRQVRRIQQQFGASHVVLEAEPMAIVRRMVQTYESQIRRFAALAVSVADSMPAVAVAALKGEAEAWERLVTLLAEVDKLPRNLELFRSEDEMRRIGEMMVERVRALERGEATPASVAAFFYGLVAPDVQEVRAVAGELEAGQEVVRDG